MAWFRFSPPASPPEADIWRLQALFTNFRRILKLNNAALALMGEMEQALGGEYIFDQTFLINSVRRVATQVHHSVYCLNALTGNAHVPLYDRHEDILGTLNAILAGQTEDTPLTLPLAEVGWELESVVGIEPVCLAELGRHSGLPVAEGVVLLASAVDALRTPDKHALAEQALAEAMAAWAPRDGDREMTRVIGIGEPTDETPEPADLFTLTMPKAATAREVASAIRKAMVQADRRPLLCVIVVCDPGGVAGVVRTQDDAAPGQARIEAWAYDVGTGKDTYLVRRAHPSTLTASILGVRPPGTRFEDGLRATDQGPARSRRGSALVLPSVLTALTETAMVLERMLGATVEMRWSGGLAPRILRARPLPVKKTTDVDVAACLARATVLCQGGQPVQSGVAAGQVVHVREDSHPGAFPLGAVAVARAASPRLAPILRRAAAIVTEQGSAAGHLATVARELRLPAAFGAPEALLRIPNGAEVTVDATEGRIYAGVFDELLRFSAEGGLIPSDPEYRTLRRLLRFIMPLHLTDPEAPEFSPEGCRTMHDLLHYCHERAVDELAHFQDRRPELGAIRSRRLRLDLPLAVRVLDIGRGLDSAAGGHPGPEDVRSLPFIHFLRGLTQPRAWNAESARLGLGDIVASLPQTTRLLQAGADTLEESLAVIDQDYLNLSLRTGYHFSVVDALIGPDQSRNHVSFRFGGGAAGGKGRERRARFVSGVLERMDFQVTRTADLVAGRLKLVDAEDMHEALRTLGCLTAFCRQQDTAMRSDADVDRLAAAFDALRAPRPDTEEA